MKKFFKVLGIVVLFLIVAATIAWFGFLRPKPPPISDADRAQIVLMPLPSELELGSDQLVLNTNFGYTFNNLKTPKLERAIKRFYSRLNAATRKTFTPQEGKTLLLDCKNENGPYPNLKDDASYTLSVTPDAVTISANSETGILYGLESLLQLMKNQAGVWALPEIELKDHPRFPWRGLMIDVARHWVSKETILRNLDAMEAVKMNVLHWHLSEYQAFRVESKIFPKLHEMGSQGKFYSQEDIKEIVAYAADRGIRVVPEFDMPGHTTAWFVGYPELASAPGPYVLDSVFGILDPVINPTRDEVYDFLDRFVGEMATLFPDDYLHIGGDEVKPAHWDANPAIQKFMKEQAIKDSHELQAYFNFRLQKILAKHGKQMMGWDEILHSDLPKDGIVVQSWRSQKSLWEAARSGNKAVLSTGYYLDHKRPASFHYNVDPMKIEGGVTIDIDSTNWKGYECKLFVQGTEIDGFLYFFGEGENLRGVMNFMGDATDFPNAKIEGDKITFGLKASVGTINFEVAPKADSILGQAKIAIITIDLKGKQVGGSDMPNGQSLPKFEKIVPLTAEQEKNILGGEACMWSEMVDNRTVDSMIWPRAAAIAEKLWSPKILTNNVDDMYRRLLVLDDELEKMGLQHHSSGKELVLEIATQQFEEPLQTLVDVLQEDEFFNRMQIYEPVLYTTTPLNRIVDAARPESYVAYSFNKDVDLWLKTADADAKARIMENLENWSENYTKLRPAFGLSEKLIEGNPISLVSADVTRLQEVEVHSENLSALSKMALQALQNKTGASTNQAAIDTLLLKAREPHGGTIMPIVDGLQKLLNHTK
ncbi:MAG: beta-N-acetylhexosaminidase [Maribacter sp.]|nr:beta-N-acetylhexosaminidase [Maribacter sp.]